MLSDRGCDDYDDAYIGEGGGEGEPLLLSYSSDGLSQDWWAGRVPASALCATAMMGTPMLGLPFAFERAGAAVSLVCLILAALWSHVSIS